MVVEDSGGGGWRGATADPRCVSRFLCGKRESVACTADGSGSSLGFVH